MTSAIPRQSPSQGEPNGDRGARGGKNNKKNKPPETRLHMIVRRSLTLAIIVLLIGIPAGYLLVSAEQSREGGVNKEREAANAGLTVGFPSQVQRRIYHLPIPLMAQNLAYYETNNWKTSRMHVRFATTPADLDVFLKSIGTSTAALKQGEVTIRPHDQATVGWVFTPHRKWSGLTYAQKDPLPTVDITVDRTVPQRPWVYAVSTASP
ncbi:sugar kinase [Streptomyces sp. NBC_00237]|uniref:sugar kinase n=1 Tax=Streptomyces sp. NBC_00237 TaxID=2975687 RepID=UPI00225292FB|nr:sugar kinase [Streptomyces sp. NBC_00237]MCX5203262.1 sugar kinase [Streptomyces sp. NBC_00237]